MRACPFCGKNAAKIIEKTIKATRGDQHNYYVRCNACFARGPVKDNATFAVLAWDNEAKDEAPNLFDAVKAH